MVEHCMNGVPFDLACCCCRCRPWRRQQGGDNNGIDVDVVRCHSVVWTLEQWWMVTDGASCRWQCSISDRIRVVGRDSGGGEPRNRDSLIFQNMKNQTHVPQCYSQENNMLIHTQSNAKIPRKMNNIGKI